MTSLLEVDDLHTAFSTRAGMLEAVRGVSLRVQRGEALGIVGESGSGKSVTALSVMQLLPATARVTGGTVLLDGLNLIGMRESQLQKIRGKRIGIVFQDSMTALNPVARIGIQITEPMLVHLDITRKAARQRAAALLTEVGVPEPERRLDQYPHQLSGGLRQRAAVAAALAADPELLIADEPTTALDATVQAQLLDLLRREQQKRGMALIMISHDLASVSYVANRVCVMYGGRIVEEGPVGDVLAQPRHPYSAGLVASVPRLDDIQATRLRSIPGAPPALDRMPQGCSFAPRCSRVLQRCRSDDPALTRQSPHAVACWDPLRSDGR